MQHGDAFCTCCGKSLAEWAEGQGYLGREPVQLNTLDMIKESFRSLFDPSPVVVPPNMSIYLNRPPHSLVPYILGALTLFAVGLMVTYGGEWMTYLGYLVAGYAAPLVYLVYMVRSDRYEREPLALVAYCFGWGAFSGIAAAVFNTLITEPFLGVGGAGFIEEPLKIFGVYLIAKSSRVKDEFNDHIDGMVYGAAAGAGFAGLENFWYLYEMIVNLQYPALTAILLRSTTAFMHLAWSAIAGRSLGLAKVLKGDIELVDIVPGVVVAAVIHMMWNLSDPFIAFAVILPFMLASLRQQIRTGLGDEERWGYKCFAPDEDEGAR
ncbi:MAG: PrsW family glutamic-type intramembrane protease [Candidatus Bathyarchaeota archaeon]